MQKIQLDIKKQECLKKELNDLVDKLNEILPGINGQNRSIAIKGLYTSVLYLYGQIKGLRSPGYPGGVGRINQQKGIPVKLQYPAAQGHIYPIR